MVLRMARLTYDAGETSGNVPHQRSDFGNAHAYNGLWTSAKSTPCLPNNSDSSDTDSDSPLSPSDIFSTDDDLARAHSPHSLAGLQCRPCSRITSRRSVAPTISHESADESSQFVDCQTDQPVVSCPIWTPPALYRQLNRLPVENRLAIWRFPSVPSQSPLEEDE
ncbi:unnamed protein product [Protopolystoma xenopodis]|uniref:Uncharacterized protein n=1 Tax=Protopolystoma xenopodis TaxID=117903 RepID=A0A3S4ZUZ6_9PLAT|nr:unnamed protein product [Protopolystoma xenopodis]